jgi:hypothetical protein
MESRLTPAAAEQVHEHRHQRTGAGHNRPDLVLDEGHVLHHIAHTPPCLRPDHLDFTGQQISQQQISQQQQISLGQ